MFITNTSGRWPSIWATVPKGGEQDVWKLSTPFDHSKIVHLDDSADDVHQASVYDAHIVSKSRSGLHVLRFHCSLSVSLIFSTLWLCEYRISIYVITHFPYSNSHRYCTTYLKPVPHQETDFKASVRMFLSICIQDWPYTIRIIYMLPSNLDPVSWNLQQNLVTLRHQLQSFITFFL